MYMSDEEKENPGTQEGAEEQGTSPEEAIEDIQFKEGKAPKAAKNESATPEEFADALYGVPIKITTVLGAARMSIDHLLQLGRGSVIQLNKNVDEPVDICVNDRLIARGELVLVGGKLGVTVTELIKESL